MVPRVEDVEVEVVSDDSVRVSWDRVNLTKITGYTVYYSPTGNGVVDGIETSLHVTNSMDSIVVGNLLSGVEYQFQVAATRVQPNGEMRTGRRSIPNALTTPNQGGRRSYAGP